MQLRYIILAFSFLVFCKSTTAQELNIDVRINTPTLKTADPKVFRTLENTIREFINNKVWTDDDFEPEEKIEGSLQITITEDLSPTSFIANFQLTTSRPVYSSNYYTPLLNHLDKSVPFTYQEFAPLFDNKTSYSDNLSSILTYYVYVILAFDYDTFSPFGGEEYFQIARNIVSQIPSAQSGADQGWAVGSRRSRYQMIDDVLNPKMREYRQSYYNYHRTGLDKMYADAQLGRSEINGALKVLGDVNRNFPNSMIMQMFTDSKREEILEIFQNTGSGEKRKIYDIMTAINPSQANLYGVLK